MECGFPLTTSDPLEELARKYRKDRESGEGARKYGKEREPPPEIRTNMGSQVDLALLGYDEALEIIESTLTNNFKIKPEQTRIMREITSNYPLRADELEEFTRRFVKYEPDVHVNNSEGWIRDWKGHYLASLIDSSVREGTLTERSVLDLRDLETVYMTWSMIADAELEIIGKIRIYMDMWVTTSTKKYGVEKDAHIIITERKIYNHEGEKLFPPGKWGPE